MQPNVTPRTKMLNAIKLIASAEAFEDVTPEDFVKTPEKPTRRTRAVKKTATDIHDVDETFLPIVLEEEVDQQ